MTVYKVNAYSPNCDGHTTCATKYVFADTPTEAALKAYDTDVYNIPVNERNGYDITAITAAEITDNTKDTDLVYTTIFKVDYKKVDNRWKTYIAVNEINPENRD